MKSVNYDILNVPATTDVIPSYAVTFSEAALYVAESIETDFQAMMESIGTIELDYFKENGSRIVYEADSKEGKSIKETIIGWVQSAWAAIKEAFEKVLKFFDDKRREYTADKLADIKGITKDDLEKYLPKDFEPNTYSYSGLSSVYFADMKNQLQFGDSYNTSDLFKMITGEVYDNIKDMKAAMEDVIKGEALGRDDVVKNFEKIKAVLITNHDIDVIKKAYSTTKSYLDKVLSQLKSAGDDKVTTAGITAMKSYIQINNAFKAMVLDAHRQRLLRYSILCFKVKNIVLNAKKNDANKLASDINTSNKKVKKESVEFQSQLETVQSLFDF